MNAFRADAVPDFFPSEAFFLQTSQVPQSRLSSCPKYFRRKRRLLYSLLAAVLLSAFVLAFLVWNGYLLLNNPSRERYPVRGVDVSKYQGEIDWPVLAEQEISFAFIKATEGNSHVDARFAYNYEEARKTGLRVGAYHFFSFDSGGDTQAENFIRNVEAFEGMLPPVIDLEFYGDKAENPPGREDFCYNKLSYKK